MAINSLVTTLTGNEIVYVLGQDLRGKPAAIQEATNTGSIAKTFTTVGTFTVNGAATVTVSDTSVTASSIISPTVKTPTGTVGVVVVKSKTAGTGFTVFGTAGDTSVYDYSRTF